MIKPASKQNERLGSNPKADDGGHNTDMDTFAKQFNADVLLLHVVETPTVLTESLLLDEGLLGANAHEKAAKELSQWGLDLLSGVRSKAVIRDHVSAPHEIVTAAAENNADLIILGTQGRTGLAHLLIGSTAERVVRHAQCPVLVVRDKETDFVAAAQDSSAGCQRSRSLKTERIKQRKESL